MFSRGMERARGRVVEGPMTLRGGQMLGAPVVAFFFVTLAWAGAPTDTVKVASDEVIRILENPALKSRTRRSLRTTRSARSRAGFKSLVKLHPPSSDEG